MPTVFIISNHGLKIIIECYCLIFDVCCSYALALTHFKAKHNTMLHFVALQWKTCISNLQRCMFFIGQQRYLTCDIVLICRNLNHFFGLNLLSNAWCKHITDAYRLSGCSKIEMAESNLTASTIMWGTEGLMALTNRGIPSTDSSIDFRPCYLN